MYKSSKTGKLYYIVTSKQGVVEQYEFFKLVPWQLIVGE
jgi:myo-inositol-hexaphosphate 3-phosphohydrolase